MDELVTAVESHLHAHFEKQREQQLYLRTPNVEKVVYFPVREQSKIVRGTIQPNGRWLYEYVPGIGY